MEANELMTTAEVGEYLRTPVATMRFWRAGGEVGPRSFKLGKRVMYRRSDVEAWLQQQYDAAEAS